MNRIARWQIWVPRLLLVAVMFMAAQLGLGLAVRSVAIRSSDQMLGSHINIGNARVSLAERQIVLHDLSLENARHPGESLLEADSCDLELAPQSLLHKQAVVTHGRVNGLRFSSFDNSSA